jgi:hypothetical protein
MLYGIDEVMFKRGLLFFAINHTGFTYPLDSPVLPCTTCFYTS